MYVGLALMILAGCDGLFGNGENDANNGESTGIEIAGSWAGDDGDDYVGPFVITMSETSFTNAYENGDSVTGVVVGFDNESNFAVVRVTAHFVTSFIGKYLKFAWITEPTSTTSLQSYTEADTSAAAEGETTVVWGPYVVTKI